MYRDGKKYTLWNSGIEAWSYVTVFAITVLIPMLISFKSEYIRSVDYVILLFNAIVLIRDYTICSVENNKAQEYIIKCVVGLVLSILSGVISIEQIMYIMNFDKAGDTVLYQIGCILLTSTIVIGCIDGAQFIIKDFRDAQISERSEQT